jgi:hypothetical protein
MTPVELVCFHHAGDGSGRESRCDKARYVDADACARGRRMSALLAYSLAQQIISRRRTC